MVSTIIRLTDASSSTLIASAAGYPDYTIRIWDIEGKTCIKIMEEAGLIMIQLADGRLASSSKDKKVKIWNYHAGHCEQVIEQGDEVRCLLQLSDHRLVAGSNYFVKVWNIQSNRADCLQTISHKREDTYEIGGYEIGANEGIVELTIDQIVTVYTDSAGSDVNLWTTESE